MLEVDGDYDPGRVRTSIDDILGKNDLLTMATSREGNPHAATMFYAETGDLVLYVLTYPDSRHARHLQEDPSVALTVYSTDQKFTDEKQGLQLSGEAKLVEDGECGKALETYSEKFPGTEEFASDPSDVEDLESSFYRIEIERVKVFDEPRFGTETWVVAGVSRRNT